MSKILSHSGVSRLTLAFLLLALFGVRGAEGQPLPDTLRIGLRTRQAEIRLQSDTLTRVETVGTDPLPLPAGQTLIFRAGDKGGTLVDEVGIILLSFTGAAQVIPAPLPPVEGAALTVPLIRLLGPTRHYDGRPDRPYRGYLEILPRPDGLTAVNVVNVEDYLRGVVSSEMSPNYPPEALKAQAVAARTYAQKNRGKLTAQGCDLDDTAACQVYGGYFSEDSRSSQAVDNTAGVVMTYDGKLIDAVYASTCGGYTESAEEAWGHATPYLVSVPDFAGDVANISPRPCDETGWAAYCKTARALNCLQPKYARAEVFRWVKVMTRREVEAALPADSKVGTLRALTPLRRGQSGRITALRVDGSERGVTLTSELNIRRALGNLRSSAFTVDAYPDDNGVPVVFVFWGAGWGDGLGMCQVGAVGLAEQGWSYDKILAYYYRGISLEKR